jgi:hypothetical protein
LRRLPGHVAEEGRKGGRKGGRMSKERRADSSPPTLLTVLRFSIGRRGVKGRRVGGWKVNQGRRRKDGKGR